MNSASIIFTTGILLLVSVLIANWNKVSYHNIRKYKVTVVLGILSLLVVVVATALDVQFIGLDVIPWYSYATLGFVAVLTLLAGLSWIWIHNKTEKGD
jgi:hypothetical protein